MGRLLGYCGTCFQIVLGGKLDQISLNTELKVPAILNFGDDDAAISLEAIDQVRSHWPQAEIVIHSGAGHGFAHPGAPLFAVDAYQTSLSKLLQLTL